jgi:hypothetical protein
MLSSVKTRQPSEKAALGRLWWAGPLTIVTVMIASKIVRSIAAAMLQPMHGLYCCCSG